MKLKRVAWLNEDEHRNLLKYDLSFKGAPEKEAFYKHLEDLT